MPASRNPRGRARQSNCQIVIQIEKQISVDQGEDFHLDLIPHIMNQLNELISTQCGKKEFISLLQPSEHFWQRFSPYPSGRFNRLANRGNRGDPLTIETEEITYEMVAQDEIVTLIKSSTKATIKGNDSK